MPAFTARIVAYRTKWCALIWGDGKRHRVSLGNLDATEENRPAAERAFAQLEQSLKQPRGDALKDIFVAYLEDTRAISKGRMEDAWKALGPFWGALAPQHITRDRCRKYVEVRRNHVKNGELKPIQDGTIRKELSILRAAVNWAGKGGDAQFEMPDPPESKDRWLTREEFSSLLEASHISPHLAVFLHLAIATGGRKEALLEMTWPQVRWEADAIWLGRKRRGKNRPTVPMTKTLRAVLQNAQQSASSEYVVEFEGGRVSSVRTAFSSACRRAGLGSDVTPHVLRHSAAVWMAADGIPMAKIAQYLGHTDSRITERVYARFAPDHLRDAAAALEVGQIGVVQKVVQNELES